MKHLNTIVLIVFLILNGIGPIYGAGIQLPDDRGFLGIQSETISQGKADLLGFDNPHGNYITRVLKNTAAEKAGLMPFDYVYGINDEQISRRSTLIELLSAYRPGEKVTVHFIRDRKKQTLPITLGQKTDARYPEYSESGRPFLGINRHPETDDQAMGVLVYVVKASTAERIGLRDGDLITTINGYPMVDWTDISTAIDNMEVGQPIVVEAERRGQQLEFSDVIQSRRETLGKEGVVSAWTQPESAFLGIYSSDVSKEKAAKLGFDNPYGSYVTGILGNTGAEKAGIRPFDYIYGVDQFRTGAEQNLSAILRQYRPGDEVKVHLIRNRQKQTVSVTLGRRSDARTEKRSECEDPFLGVSQTSDDSPEGVRVSIVDNSTAASIGIPKGAVITRINGHPILDWTDMGTAVDILKVGETITVEYLENGQKKTAGGPIKSYCETKTRTNKLFDWDWDFDFDFDQEEPREAPRAPEGINRDISGLQATIAPVSGEEAARMRNEHKLNFANENNLRAERLSITPQPETGFFRLRFDLPQRGETSVRIYNDTGRKIYEYDLGTFSGEFSDDIDIAQNGRGNYFLLIEQSGKTYTRKIVIK